MTNERRHVLKLGKVDYNGTGRRINAVELELSLRTLDGTRRTVDLEEVDGCRELSVVGRVWNHLHTDIIAGGQLVDLIARSFPEDARVQRIAALWQRWHLNGMKSGTRAQRACLTGYELGCQDGSGDPYPSACRYDDACGVLKACGLLEDRGYRYGSSWLCDPLPPEVEAEVLALFGVIATAATEEEA